MYSRKDQHWLYQYYCGDNLDIIGKSIGRTRSAVYNRVRAMKLPCRPKGGGPYIKKVWSNEPHIRLLRALFKPR